jgi:hypothetical protein
VGHSGPYSQEADTKEGPENEMTPAHDESRTLQAINSLKELLSGVPDALRRIAVLETDHRNLRDDVKELQGDNKSQNRYIWVAIGGLAVLVFILGLIAGFVKH